MASLSLTLGRSSLGMSDLVIPDMPSPGGLVVSTISEPTFEAVYHRADAEMFTNGRRLLGATLDVGDLPVTFTALGSSSAEVAALKAELTEALWQFSYTLTLTIDGAARSWAADPSVPVWGEITHGSVSAFVAQAAVSIPLNPA